MKKTIMAMALAAMTVATTGTALAATPGQGNFQDNVSRIETNYAHCGGGYGGGYCWGNENSEG